MGIGVGEGVGGWDLSLGLRGYDGRHDFVDFCGGVFCV